MDTILHQLNNVRGVGGCLLISDDGLTIASCLRNDIDEDTLAASASSLIDSARNLSTKLTASSPTIIHSQGQDGGLVILAAGQSFLVLLTDPHANLALLQLEADPFTKTIAEKLTL